MRERDKEFTSNMSSLRHFLDMAILSKQLDLQVC